MARVLLLTALLSYLRSCCAFAWCVSWCLQARVDVSGQHCLPAVNIFPSSCIASSPVAAAGARRLLLYDIILPFSCCTCVYIWCVDSALDYCVVDDSRCHRDYVRVNPRGV